MMKQVTLFYLCVLILVMLAFSKANAQDTVVNERSGYRISLLTCGSGDEIWETFGHTAVRVVDSSMNGVMGDLVYNYGMFNGYDENFELKFMRGKLLYYVASEFYPDFMEEYLAYGRKVEEQVLLLPEDDKREIVKYLRVNTLPENRYYKYDFFFDNCATRIRDVFPAVLGANFQFKDVRPKEVSLSFRDIINEYFYRRHWERVGVNILLGSKIDRTMTNADIMFLPDYLEKGVASATLGGERIAMEPELLLDGSKHVPAGFNTPLLLTSGIFVLTLIGVSSFRLRFLFQIMRVLVLIGTGLLGCLIAVMWFATDHQGCARNANILWALPVNLYVAIFTPRGIGKYAIISMLLIVVVFVLHVSGIQAIIVEFIPLLLSLLLIHGFLYRKSLVEQSKH